MTPNISLCQLIPSMTYLFGYNPLLYPLYPLYPSIMFTPIDPLLVAEVFLYQPLALATLLYPTLDPIVPVDTTIAAEVFLYQPLALELAATVAGEELLVVPPAGDPIFIGEGFPWIPLYPLF